MAETKQINFDLKDVAIALVKQQGLRDGHWMLGFDFAFGAGNFGASPAGADAKPGAFAQIKNLTLVRQDDTATSQLPFVVDAAEVNSEKAGGKKDS
jgi:hypothetical protein